jgi:CheY-like chemotaxis protein
MMPQMDGFEFLEEMRRKAEWRDIPVVVVTAKDPTDADRIRLNGGVERIIRKPTATTCCARCAALTNAWRGSATQCPQGRR